MADQITALVARIQTIASESGAGIATDFKSRSMLLQANQELTRVLKGPDQILGDVAFSGCYYTCVRVAIEMGVFEKLSASEQPMTPKQLATECNADAALVLRLARTLVGMGFMADAMKDGEHAFAATAVTRQATIPSARAGLKLHFDQGFPVIHDAPTFFRANGFKIPQGKTDGLFNYHYKTEDDSYTYWSKQPGVMENFNTFMQGYFGSVVPTTPIEWFHHDEVALNGFDPSQGSEYVWVDVGGGKGHHVQELVDKYPDIKGKFLLQDLPNVIDDTSKDNTHLSPRIEQQRYDFFQPQPIKGARVYCLENVLHNWNDQLCWKILTNLENVMVRGYSKLIISNIITNDTNVPLLQAGLDSSMLFVHGGCQRSEEQWYRLIESSGLMIRKIWRPPGFGNGIVECELAPRIDKSIGPMGEEAIKWMKEVGDELYD